MTTADPGGPTSSASFRPRRTTTEVAFVGVPVTADLIAGQPDGRYAYPVR